MNKVTLPYDDEWRALAWAREYCPGYITNEAAPATLVAVPGGWVNVANIVYYFDNDQDVVTFSLRWL